MVRKKQRFWNWEYRCSVTPPKPKKHLNKSGYKSAHSPVAELHSSYGCTRYSKLRMNADFGTTSWDKTKFPVLGFQHAIKKIPARWTNMLTTHRQRNVQSWWVGVRIGNAKMTNVAMARSQSIQVLKQNFNKILIKQFFCGADRADRV